MHWLLVALVFLMANCANDQPNALLSYSDIIKCPNPTISEIGFYCGCKCPDRTISQHCVSNDSYDKCVGEVNKCARESCQKKCDDRCGKVRANEICIQRFQSDFCNHKNCAQQFKWPTDFCIVSEGELLPRVTCGVVGIEHQVNRFLGGKYEACRPFLSGRPEDITSKVVTNLYNALQTLCANPIRELYNLFLYDYCLK